jgi:hypothetical protein
LAQIIVALLSIVGATMLMPCPASSWYYNEDDTFEDIAIIALILSVVALFYGIYMIVAGCVPVR